ncbi:MAG: hypothetical protein GY847_15505 [Proteobacteria bacterium]|nr:hypothetical protein [Pseudomonadota bacterium]
MRVVSSELRQVFRAYTKQLRGEYAKAKKDETAKQTRAKGFERVEISDEAKALAASRQSIDRPEKTASEEPTRKQESNTSDDMSQQKTQEQQVETDTSTEVKSDLPEQE